MKPKALLEFESLWEGSTDTAPDVFQFLAGCGSISEVDRLAILACDQHHRWKTERPYDVEAYLERLPEFNNRKSKLHLALFDLAIYAATSDHN